jgi:hypothetical protein
MRVSLAQSLIRRSCSSNYSIDSFTLPIIHIGRSMILLRISTQCRRLLTSNEKDWREWEWEITTYFSLMSYFGFGFGFREVFGYLFARVQSQWEIFIIDRYLDGEKDWQNGFISRLTSILEGLRVARNFSSIGGFDRNRFVIDANDHRDTKHSIVQSSSRPVGICSMLVKIRLIFQVANPFLDWSTKEREIKQEMRMNETMILPYIH